MRLLKCKGPHISQKTREMWSPPRCGFSSVHIAPNLRLDKSCSRCNSSLLSHPAFVSSHRIGERQEEVIHEEKPNENTAYTTFSVEQPSADVGAAGQQCVAVPADNTESQSAAASKRADGLSSRERIRNDVGNYTAIRPLVNDKSAFHSSTTVKIHRAERHIDPQRPLKSDEESCH